MFVDGFKCGCSLLNLEVLSLKSFALVLTFGHLWNFNAGKIFLTSLC